MDRKGRLLVVDASLSNRIAGELRNRGRNAVAVSQLSLHRVTDDVLLDSLATEYHQDEFVLVTADDAMPLAWEARLLEYKFAVATVDPRVVPPWTISDDCWSRDAVHRWAHLMATQEPGTWRRYSPFRSRTWTKRAAYRG